MHKMNFRDFGLDKEILKALEKLEYEMPTAVQQQVIPFVLENRDIIVKSKTGSGKTASFAIPICEKIELEQRNSQVLVLTPTRELAVQVKEDIAYIGRFKKIRCAAIFGKQPIEMQKRELRQRVHVIVATPGRILDHMERKNVNLEEIKYLIIDEADEMLNMGFIDQVEAIIKTLPLNRATMLFSATMPEKIEEICNQYMIDPKRIEVDSKDSTTEKIEQAYYEVEEHRKFNLINKIIYTERPSRCIIFCNTREKVENIIRQMKNEKYSCRGLHGGMEQGERLNTMQRFKRGQFDFLVATDVAARGIHIDDVTHVINYDIPVEKESYVHRIGRTGRAGNGGIAITFVSQGDVEMLNDIEEYIKHEIPKREKEAIQEGERIFEKQITHKAKGDRSDKINREITKIRINAGKRKKMRPGDILGAISNMEGIIPKDIGIIDVQDTCSYVEIFGKKGDFVYEELQSTKIKGRIFTVKKVRFRSF
ncbi:DEAD/DEAH box helicase [Lutibacter sp. B2]|nr:DEAD/DEAH box helicase [Lutibacter sp. B2]